MLKPFYIKKKNINNRLVPPVSAADAGKLLGVDEEGNITLVEGGGGGGDEWTPKFTVHINPQTQKLQETMAEIQAFDPDLGDRVAVMIGDTIYGYTTVVSADYSGATLIKIYFGTDLFAPNIKLFVTLNSGKYELAYLNTNRNETLIPEVIDWNGTTLNLTEYDSAIIFSLSAL